MSSLTCVRHTPPVKSLDKNFVYNKILYSLLDW